MWIRRIRIRNTGRGERQGKEREVFRETREGWPLLTVENEANGDSRSTWYKKGVLSGLVRWSCRAVARAFCPALAALVGSVQNIFFLAVNFFT